MRGSKTDDLKKSAKFSLRALFERELSAVGGRIAPVNMQDM